jgi:hypothetical protein
MALYSNSASPFLLKQKSQNYLKLGDKKEEEAGEIS